MSEHEEWTPEVERAVYVARVQAIAEALADYEQAHPSHTPCLHDALQVVMGVLQP